MRDDGQRYDAAEGGFGARRPKHRRSAQKRARKKEKGERRSRKSRVPKWVYRLMIILAAAVLAVVLWLNRASLTPATALDWMQERVVGMGVGDGFPVEAYDMTVAKNNFKSMNRNIFVTSSTSITVLNPTAKELLSRQHSYAEPVMCAASGRALLFGLGGKGYQVESLSKTVVKAAAQGNILAGDMAEQGSYALLTEANGYLGLLTVYTPDGAEQFRYWFSDCYPTAVALNADGSRAAVAGVAARDGAMVSSLYLLDLNDHAMQKPAAEYPEAMLLGVDWGENGVVTAVGDTLTCSIDTLTKTRAEHGYQGKVLTAYDINNGRAALGLAPYDGAGNGSLTLLEGGKPGANVELPMAASAVSLYGNTAAALCGDKIRAFSAKDGAAAGEGKAGGDAMAVALQDESTCYVLGISEVRLVNID